MLELYARPVHERFKRQALKCHAAIDRACDVMRRATDALGADDDTLVDVLTSLAPRDRALAVYRYKDKFREELKDTLGSDPVGDFRILLLLLTMPAPEAEAFLLHMAVTRWPSREKFIYTILVGRTNEELSILKATYADLFNEDLMRRMKAELGGDLRTIVAMALDRYMEEYDPAVHTAEKAQRDADALYKAGEGRWGTDEETFIKILFSSPCEYLALLNEVYKNKYRSDLEAAVRCEFSGYATEALLHFVRLSLKPHETLARHMESTMKGLGTDEKRLSAAVIRYQTVLPAVELAYKKIYGRSLKDRVRSDTSGEYGQLLLTLLHRQPGVDAKQSLESRLDDPDPDSDPADSA